MSIFLTVGINFNSAHPWTQFAYSSLIVLFIDHKI